MTGQTKKMLTRLRLIGWHYFNNETINLKNTNLFSGENGAGKSTILDAIQMILTTNSRRFNLAANSDSSRSLKSYVRGKTGEEGNEYLRKGAVISYIALEVYEESRRRYFVIGVKIDSPDVESEPKKKWFCEEGTLDQLSFVVDNKPARDEQFKNNGKKVNFIHQTSQAKDRFRHRLGNLQDNFFELLAKSIAFKPMKDVKSFVSKFILSENKVDIDVLRENIRNLKEMQSLVEEVKKQVNNLKEIQDTYDSMLHIDRQILVIDILIKIAEMETKREDIDSKSAQISLVEQNLLQNQKCSNGLVEDITSMNDRYISMQTSLQSSENTMLINSLQSEIKGKEKDRAIALDNIRIIKEQLKRIKKVLDAATELKNSSSIRVNELGNSDMTITDRNALVIEIEKSFKETEKAMTVQLGDLTNKLNSLNSEIIQLSTEIKNLERNRITYDKNVTTLKEAVEREFSARGINSPVYILADLLEITDNAWQNAVEGYLNSQRFHLIVEPEFYDIASRVYDKYKAEIHTAAIVNTAKLKIGDAPDEHSLASVVQSENRYACAYICYLLGRVNMCDKVEQLKEYDISVTQGCMLYQGKALRKINPKIYSMPYIGKYALQQQLKIKKAEYEQKSKIKTEIEKKKKKCENISEIIKQCNFEILKGVIAAPVDLKSINGQLDTLNKKLEMAKNDSNYLRLQMEAEELRKQLDNKRNELDCVKAEITKNTMYISTVKEDINRIGVEIEEIQKQIEIMSRENEAELSEANKKFEEHKKTKSADTIFANYQPRRVALGNRKNGIGEKLIQLQTKYKEGELGTGEVVMSAYVEEYETLSKHDLISYEEKLRVIQDNCEIEFKESFIAKMRENIDSATNLFKSLNKTLKPIYYGNDSYRFDYAPDKTKKRLYDMITSDFNLAGFNLFSTQFDSEYHDEMNELFSKLTESDDNGDGVLNEYTDYRNYMDYDIEIISKDGKSQKFSKIYREKSGGETQTPYYVAIAASFVQLYSTGETIRVIMLDEAFDKMDEERIESMINFFKSQNFQIILAAPTSRLELIGEQSDNIIMIYSDSEHNSFAEEFSYDEI